MTRHSHLRGSKVAEQRNTSIELLRIIAMLLILTCHFIIHFDWNTHHYNLALKQQPGWSNALKWFIVQYGQVGVTIFFIISGFFLINKTFNWKRIFKTWFQMFCYSASFFCLVIVIGIIWRYPSVLDSLMHGRELINSILASFLPFAYNSYWFIGAYILLLLCLPFVNHLINSMDSKTHIQMLMLLAFLSIQILIFGRVSYWNNLVYAIFGYSIGAWIKKYYEQYKQYFKHQVLLILILISSAVMFIFNYYASSDSKIASFLGWKNQIHYGIWLLPIIIGSCIFILIFHIKTPSQFQKIIRIVASTTFGIYLIHENLFGFRLLWEFVSKICQQPSNICLQALAMLGIVITVFFALSLAAWVFDHIIVQPLTKLILKRLPTTQQKN